MLDNGLSADQVRCDAGVSFAEAQVACYMFAASSERTLEWLSQSTGMDRAKAREAAFRWGVQFPDYNPYAKPKLLEFRKAKPGWALHDGDEVIGECLRLDDGRYQARTFSQTSSVNWDARKAMADLARQLDGLSPDLPGFNGRPVKAVIVNKDGRREVAFPTGGEEIQRCRNALRAREAA